MAARRFTYDVFLSHSSKDKAIVRRLAERLKKDRLKVWFDEWEIRPGDSIPRKIDEGLEQSAKLLFFMSANSLGSDWASVESQTFRFTDPVNRELRFIPLRLDDTEARASLRQFAYVDWRDGGNKNAYTRLVTACRRREDQTVQKPVRFRKKPGRRSADDPIRVLSGHGAAVWSIALSADGRRVISGSGDGTIRVWDLIENRRPSVLKGHTNWVRAVALSADGRRAVSGSDDETVRVWDLEGSTPPRVLKGHTGAVQAIAMSLDGRYAISASDDKTLRLWDLEGEDKVRILRGHTRRVMAIALSADGKFAVSGSEDKTLRVWDLEDDRPTRVLEGHRSRVLAVALSGDGRRAVSGSDDKTVRVWDLYGQEPGRILEGHTEAVWGVALSNDGQYAASGSDDMTVRIWDLGGVRSSGVLTGHAGGVNAVVLGADGRTAISGSDDRNLHVWDLGSYLREEVAEKRVRYTNAKVVIVGESGSGKTGITVRLAHGLPPSRWPSTSGVWSTQCLLKNLPTEAGWDRELWLWDFGGQADQRLIHQLYLDRTAAVLLMFDGGRDAVLSGLREWQQALARCISPSVPVLLLAGRTDVGSRFDRARVEEFARESNYPFFETSAENNRGVSEMREALLKAIPWGSLDRHDSPARFKRLKDEILLIRDGGKVTLATFKELESLLTAKLPAKFRFSSAELRTVVSLLDSPGVVKELDFGSYILLRPEWINIYAQAVIRTLRAAELGLGYIPVRAIREGKLIFQSSQAHGQPVEEKRLKPEDEQIVLQSMEAVLLERRLCLQQDGDLVFPSYCGRERPVGPLSTHHFVSYTIEGFLDDIYATLVVKLAHCGVFKLKDLWRDAADFETLAGQKHVGIMLRRREEGGGEILAHHVAGATGEELVLFASYIHQHLIEQSTTKVLRLRQYICPNCNEPVTNRELAMERLLERGESAEIICPRCEQRVSLWDRIEELFADERIREQVRTLRVGELKDLDTRRLGKLLVHEVSARILSADQKCVEIPQEHDDGIDLEVEFTDTEGRGTAKRMYLQLKAGNSHLTKRKSDGAEIFKIHKSSWVDYWIKTSANGPVMLVIGTFPDPGRHGAHLDKREFAEVRWMEIGELLRQKSGSETRPLKQIVFDGERLDAASILRWRDKVLKRE
jgi:small GTP-binding protein